MHRLIALAVLTTLGSHCAAEWVKYGESAISRSFFDPTTLVVNQSVRRVWLLQNLTSPDQSGDRSYKVYMEYDCQGARFRSLRAEYFPLADGRGRLSSSRTSAEDWNQVVPGSVGETAALRVCASVQQKPQQAELRSGDSLNIANWRALRRGMKEIEVKALLGEPVRVEGGYITYWRYGNDANIQIIDEKLYGWNEPR